ncbi:hypothetical protein AAG570_004563 [Ranatra chinensis]|uniref:Ig-like domain-containing protein n=1 Tax=Ranatra chinensis TaxID=642074 RepID=A0ABD0Y205_9HEMI
MKNKRQSMRKLKVIRVLHLLLQLLSCGLFIQELIVVMSIVRVLLMTAVLWCACDCVNLLPSMSTTLNALTLFYDKVREQQEMGQVMMKRLKFGRHNPISFSSVSPLEYPSTDKVKMEALNKLWQAYYACSNAQRNIFGRWRILSPRAYTALEGTSITLQCLLCRSPRDMTVNAMWYYSKNMMLSDLPQIQDRENTLIDSMNQDLHIFNVGKSDAGIYQCRVGHSVTQPYFLHVFGSDEEPVRVVHGHQAPKGPYAAPPIYLSDHVLLETSWGQWTRCSKCNKVGKRYRLGSCMVRVSSYPDRAKFHEDAKNAPVWIKEILALSLFYQGVPCRSQLVPPRIRKVEGVLTRPSEIMVSYCKVACSDTMFEMMDYKGQTVHSFNNTAGEFSVLQEAPRLQKAVARQYLTVEVDDHVVFGCPGSQVVAPYEWFMGRRRIVPEIVASETKGRMTIDPIGRFIIKQVIDHSTVSSNGQGAPEDETVKIGHLQED